MSHETPPGSSVPTAPPTGHSSDFATSPTLSEFEETLKRLVDRIARILQAEKCVFLLHDPVSAMLYATEPALGITRDQLHAMEYRVTDGGFSAEVFRTTSAVILYDAANDPRALSDRFSRFGIQNAVSVPLIVEKRDEDNRVVDRTTVGVLHVFNKKRGLRFDEEDVSLLKSMASQGAAVIAQAQLYREVVHEKQELIHTIDSLYAGLLMVGMTGRVVQINPSARAILGLSPDSPVIGMAVSEAVGDERVRRLLYRALEGETPEIAEEITFAVKDPVPEDEQTERVYQIQCAPVRDDADEPAGIVAIFNDITDIRGVDRIKTAFISTVSHELRTPLTSIKGFISTLLADNEGFYDETTRREFYSIIDTECDRLTRLITDLLDISRIEQGRAVQMNWEDTDVPALVSKVISAQRAYAKDHTLLQDFPDDFPLVTADTDKLGQILTNLINNAIKYSPGGGEVEVIGRVVGPSNLPAGREAAISLRIVDHGMGISREHLPKLFERFYRVDNRDSREIGGTGIGLALVQALVEEHHGKVTVDSEPGRGSVFTVILPLKQPDGRD